MSIGRKRLIAGVTAALTLTQPIHQSIAQAANNRAAAIAKLYSPECFSAAARHVFDQTGETPAQTDNSFVVPNFAGIYLDAGKITLKVFDHKGAEAQTVVTWGLMALQTTRTFDDESDKTQARLEFIVREFQRFRTANGACQLVSP